MIVIVGYQEKVNHFNLGYSHAILHGDCIEWASDINLTSSGPFY